MPISVFTVTMTSGQNLPDNGVDLSEMGWKKVMMEIPTTASGSFQLYAATGLSETYRPCAPMVATQNVASIYTIDSSVVANGCVAEVPAGLQYVKPRNTSGATDAVKVIKFICTY